MHDKMTFEKLDCDSVDYVLTTTRNVRKRLDLTRQVPIELIEECIEIAVQAPTGCNAQTWRFLIVTNPEKRREVAELYSKRPADSQNLKTLELLGISTSYPEGDPRQFRKGEVMDSALHLSGHLGEVPVLIIACIEGRLEANNNFVSSSFYGSILPAVWSLMLALRSRGLASAWTTVHLENEVKVAGLFGIPTNVTQVALLPVAYPIGTDFRPAERLPARDVIYRDKWGAKAG